MSASLKDPSFMSTGEFLAWDAGDGLSWQLVDGVPQSMAPASRTHGLLQSEFVTELNNHFRQDGSGCTVVTAPGIVPHVYASHNVRVPDLAVTCQDDGNDAILATPVLIVEILSPSNRAETWGNVWTYTTIPSVMEIVVISSMAIRVDLLRRRADGTWPTEPECLEDGELILQSVGLVLSVPALYRTTRLRSPAG